MEAVPGSALVEKELTARFGTSRTPVREALIRLKEEGLVEIFPQAGTFVARIPTEAIPEAVFIRQALECATVDLVALDAAVRWEPSRGGQLFPHVYADLPLRAVIAHGPVEWLSGGTVRLPG